MAKVNLADMDRAGMTAFFRGLGEAPFRTQQVLRWLHRQGVTDFAQMTNISRPLRERLQHDAEVAWPEIVSERISSDGTRKWLLRLHDGNCIETVFIPEEDRGTLCVSSQVGCPLDCSFCATGHQGFSRNLGVGEILGQVWQARRLLFASPEADFQEITNIVLMGMGEPLLNLANVTAAIDVLVDDALYGIGRRRVTLSTAGLVPGIDRLREACDVSLAVSLHAPDDALRDELVPLNKKFPLHELMAACRRYVAGRPRSKVTFEYAMLDGVNDRPEQAKALACLLRDIPAKVNLIPFNPFPGARYRRSSDAAINRFREILLGAGLVTVTRRTRGDEIDAACGQLVGDFRSRVNRASGRAGVSMAMAVDHATV